MAKAAPSLADWKRQLGASTAGTLVSRMSSADQRKVYQAFLAGYAKHPDLVEASMTAVGQYQSKQGSFATPKPSTRTQRSGPSAVTQPGSTPTTQPATAPDTASQLANNPTASSLTQGRFTPIAATSSLFSSGGLDLSTTLTGTMPGSAANYPTGRYAPMPDTAKDAANAATPAQIATQTADEWLTGLYKMTTAELSALQADLFKSGWYDPTAVHNPKDIPFGRVDPETIKAFESVMLDTARHNAAGKPLTIQQVLGAGAPRVPGATKLKLPSFDITNPANVQAAFATQAGQLVGGGLGDQQGAFASTYATQEQTAYNNLAAAGQDRAVGLGGAYVGRPDPSAAARQFILGHDQQDVVNYDMALRTVQFQNALKEL